MSINIQLEGKLKKLSGQSVSKDKITTALGYTPASTTDLDTVKVSVSDHINDVSKHFSGNYSDLKDKPNISTDDDKDLVIADESGNVVFKIDEQGTHTTKLELLSGDVDTQLDTLKLSLSEHENDQSIHFSGNYDDLKDAPNISTDDDKDLVVTDEAGNIVMRVDENGINTTDVKIHGESVITKIDTVATTVDTHEKKTDIHVTQKDKDKWNNPTYSALPDAPNISTDEEDKDLVIADEAGNIVFKIDEQGTHTTKLELLSGDVDTQLDTIKLSISNHDKTENHVTTDDKARWDAKSDFSGSYNDLTNLPTDHATTNYVDTAVDTVATNLSTHTSKTDIHVTQEDKDKWNNPTYSALPDAPNITTDDDKDLVIADESGNVVFKVDESGTHTTKLELLSGDVDTQLDAIKVDVSTLQKQITGLSGAMHFVGVKNSVPTTGLDEYKVGDVIVVGEKEYVFNNGAFIELGDVTEEGKRIKALEDAVNHTETGLATKASQTDLDTVATNLTNHTSKTDIHVTQEDKDKWNNPTYSALPDAPNISTDEEDKDLVITDESGNIVLRVDEEGTHTTKLELLSGDVDTQLDTIKLSISGHTGNGDIHVTASDKAKWDAKSDFNGSYNSLIDLPTNHATTTQVDTVATNLSTHTEKTDIHVTASDKETWNNKSDFSGNYNELENRPVEPIRLVLSKKEITLTDTGWGIPSYEESSDITFDVGSTYCVVWNDVEYHLEAKEHNNYPTLGNLSFFNELESTNYEDSGEDFLITFTNIGEICLTVFGNVGGQYTLEIYKGRRLDKSYLPNTVWTKENFNGSYNDLTDAPNISTDEEDKDLVITDEDGNIVMRVDESGLETTVIDAQKVVVNGTDVETCINQKSQVQFIIWEDDD